MSAKLTVGDFSRVTHLSVKTLRHYHRVGLLEPAVVSAETGYRYYSVEQVPTAQVIKRLRDMEMPVSDVKAVLCADDTPARNALISTHLDRLQSELARTQTAVEALRSLLEQPTSVALDVEHRTVGPVDAIAVQEDLERSDVLLWWQGALGELHATIQAQGLRQTAPAGGLYASGLYQDDRGQATVFIPVAGHPRPIGRIVPYVVTPGELAIVTHRGPLGTIDVTFGALGSYTARNEISVDGPLREFYLVDAHENANPESWITEVGWPIFRADPGQTGTASSSHLVRGAREH